MFLYATVTRTGDNSRPARKGGDECLEIELTRNSKPVARIVFTKKQIIIKGETQNFTL